jgi:hypothetical protein
MDKRLIRVVSGFLAALSTFAGAPAPAPRSVRQVWRRHGSLTASVRLAGEARTAAAMKRSGIESVRQLKASTQGSNSRLQLKAPAESSGSDSGWMLQLRAPAVPAQGATAAPAALPWTRSAGGGTTLRRERRLARVFAGRHARTAQSAGSNRRA